MLRPDPPATLFSSTDFSPLALGSTDVLTIDHGQIHAAGWAYLTDKKRPPECVVITREVNGQPEPFAIAFPRINRADVRSALKIKASLTGWDVTAPVPSDASGIRAWAVDGDNGATHPLHMPPAK